jgi:hypothetical protein
MTPIPGSRYQRSAISVNFSTVICCQLAIPRVGLAQFLAQEEIMRQRRNRQLPLPFTEQTQVWTQLPLETRLRCRTLLARLLVQVRRAAGKEGRNHEQRKN